MPRLIVLAALVCMGCSSQKVTTDEKEGVKKSHTTSKCPPAGVAQPNGGNPFGITSPASFTDSCEQSQR